LKTGIDPANRRAHQGHRYDSNNHPQGRQHRTHLVRLNLRERNGYAYGAGSGFAFRRGPGPFVATSSVRTDATAPAVKEIFNELRSIREAEVTPAELTLSRDSLARSLPGMFETSSSMAGSSAQLFVHGLPLDYYQKLPQSILAVTAADVLRVAREHLQPERMVSVVVGDRAKVEDSLKALGIGPVEVRQAE
jgi:zinc protease